MWNRKGDGEGPGKGEGEVIGRGRIWEAGGEIVKSRVDIMGRSRGVIRGLEGKDHGRKGHGMARSDYGRRRDEWGVCRRVAHE